jgi:probable F420-dependent oxidoreductase
MKFALHFGNNTFPDFAGAARLARSPRRPGFDSVLAVDHVVFPDTYSSTYPYSATGRLPVGRGGAFPDPLIWIAYAAAVTTRLRFLTGVVILPQRDPLVLAKQVATLDYMSGGRFELGIGVGWLKEEFQALGVPFERRGRRADEYVAAMKALWAEDGATFSGEFVNFKEVSCNPKPIGRVPIIVGGHSEAAGQARRPAGRWVFSIDWLSSRYFSSVRRGAPRRGGGRPRSCSHRDDCRLSRSVAQLDRRAAGRHRGTQASRRRSHCPAGRPVHAEPRRELGALRRHDHPSLCGAVRDFTRCALAKS